MKQLSFRTFVSFAEKLHDQAVSAESRAAAMPYVIGSILTSWIAVESFVNNMMQDYAVLPAGMFSIHERGFLQEKQVQFIRAGKDAGCFSISESPEFKRVEDKILFLIAKVGRGNVDKGAHLWQQFEKVKKKRNALVHYRKGYEIELTVGDSQEAIEMGRELIEFLSKKVWKQLLKW